MRMRGGPRVFRSHCVRDMEAMPLTRHRHADKASGCHVREHVLMQCAYDDFKEQDPPQWALGPWHTELIMQRIQFSPETVANIVFQQKWIMDVLATKAPPSLSIVSHEYSALARRASTGKSRRHGSHTAAVPKQAALLGHQAVCPHGKRHPRNN